jgi:hypothetical protein
MMFNSTTPPMTSKLPETENVAICFAQKICWLSPAVRVAIHLLSMFGYSAKLEILINASLQQAEMEGLVNNIVGRISYSLMIKFKMQLIK